MVRKIALQRCGWESDYSSAWNRGRSFDPIFEGTVVHDAGQNLEMLCHVTPVRISNDGNCTNDLNADDDGNDHVELRKYEVGSSQKAC